MTCDHFGAHLSYAPRLILRSLYDHARRDVVPGVQETPHRPPPRPVARHASRVAAKNFCAGGPRRRVQGPNLNPPATKHLNAVRHDPRGTYPATLGFDTRARRDTPVTRHQRSAALLIGLTDVTVCSFALRGDRAYRVVSVDGALDRVNGDRCPCENAELAVVHEGRYREVLTSDERGATRRRAVRADDLGVDVDLRFPERRNPYAGSFHLGECPLPLRRVRHHYLYDDASFGGRHHRSFNGRVIHLFVLN